VRVVGIFVGISENTVRGEFRYSERIEQMTRKNDGACAKPQAATAGSISESLNRGIRARCDLQGGFQLADRRVGEPGGAYGKPASLAATAKQ